jgi:hypothetical protein
MEKIEFLLSTNFKSPRHIKGISIKDCEFFLTFIICLGCGQWDYSPQALENLSYQDLAEGKL